MLCLIRVASANRVCYKEINNARFAMHGLTYVLFRLWIHNQIVASSLMQTFISLVARISTSTVCVVAGSKPPSLRASNAKYVFMHNNYSVETC